VEFEQLRDRFLVDRLAIARNEASTASTGPPGVSIDSKGCSASRNQTTRPPITRPTIPKKR
jgi:hypothetical protein